MSEERNFVTVTAGQTVENFLSQINDNFDNAQFKIDGAPSKIFFRTESPDSDSGVNGDIWIQYEEPEQNIE